MESVIKATQLCKNYSIGDTVIKALDNIDLEIFKGEFVAIVGKSGSGKSTLMHILGLLDTPTSGHVVLKGIDVTKYSEKQLARIRNKEIGFVFQFFNLLNRATTLENVTLPLKYSTTPKNKWNELARIQLEQVGLLDRIHNRSNELSGGQKQRVAIARALVNDPEVIFADEPTGNLDSKTGDEITEMFKNLNAKGKTIILVTHDEDLAKIAQRQIVIRDGKIVK
jgi:putative ABC transport system ATP-binding protein